MAFYKQDIVDINLNTGSIFRSFLAHSIGFKDDDADRFGIRAFRDGEPVDLSGASCQAVFMAPNGVNIALTSYGTISGNVAYVTLPQACYDYEGQFCLAIKLVGGGVTGTVRIVDGTVTRTGASGAVTPTSAVPTYQEILATYDAMVAATSAANLAIAEEFDASKNYPAGKNVINDGDLYVLPNGHTAGTTWANTTKVASNLGDQVSELKSALNIVSKAFGNALFYENYDLSNLTAEQYIQITTGAGLDSQYVKASTYLPVKSGDIIFYNAITTSNVQAAFAFYTSKTYTSVVQDSIQEGSSNGTAKYGLYIAPSDGYVRFSSKKDDSSFYAFVIKQLQDEIEGKDDLVFNALGESSYFTKYVQSDLTNNQYLDKDSGLGLTSETMKLSTYFRVKSGDIIFYAARTDGVNQAAFGFFTDKTYSAFVSASAQVGSANTKRQKGFYIAPSDGYVRFSSMGSYNDFCAFITKNIVKYIDKEDELLAHGENYDLIPVAAIAENHKIKTTGQSESDNSSDILKYKVSHGNVLWLKLSKDNDVVYQFQNNVSIPGVNVNNYIIGDIITKAVDGLVVVPTGATYLMVSQLKTNTANVVKLIYDKHDKKQFPKYSTSEDIKNACVISDTITYTCGFSGSMCMDKERGIAYVINSCSKTRYGESTDIRSLAIVPMAQPERTIYKEFMNDGIVVDGNTYTRISEMNLIYLGSGVVRVIFSALKNYGTEAKEYYADYDTTTETLGAFHEIYIEYGTTDAVLSPTTIMAYLTANGYSDGEYYYFWSDHNSTKCVITSHIIERSGKYYGLITGSKTYPVLFESSDNLQTLKLIGIVPDKCIQEADLAFDGSNNVYALLRKDNVAFSQDETKGKSYYMSSDGGETWTASDTFDLLESLNRPRMCSIGDKVAVCYNVPGQPSFVEMERSNAMIQIGTGIGNDYEVYDYVYNKKGIIYPDIFVFNKDLYIIFSDSSLYLDYSISGKDCAKIADLGTVL